VTSPRVSVSLERGLAYWPAMRPIGEHDRHLEDRLDAVADLVGGRPRERLGAVTALQQERLTAGGARQAVAQHVDLAREDERGQRGQLGRGCRDRGAVGPLGLLLDREGAPVVEPGDDGGVSMNDGLEGVDHGGNPHSWWGVTADGPRRGPGFPAYRAFAGRLSLTVVA